MVTLHTIPITLQTGITTTATTIIPTAITTTIITLTAEFATFLVK